MKGCLRMSARPRLLTLADCDTPRMARKPREIERVQFSVDDLDQVVGRMTKLADAGDGWINVIPHIADYDDKPTSLGFLTLLSGGGARITMCTWIPGCHDRQGRTWTSLGISQLTGRRAVPELYSLSAPIPQTWLVEQDHPRRGLVLRVPPADPHGQVMAWALRAVSVLNGPGPIARWRADVYLPTVKQGDAGAL